MNWIAPPVRNPLLISVTAMLVIVGVSPSARSQNTSRPGSVLDISGVWMLAGRQIRLFPNGDAPFTPWGQAKFKAANPETNDPNLACLPEGLPRFMFVPLPMEIFQVPTRVVIIHEGTQVMRQIYMNRQHPKDLDPTYSGDSVGRWKGGALVIDTIGFNDKTWLDNGGLPHSEDMHLIERIRRLDHDTLVDDFTIEDPKVYTKPIKSQQIYKSRPAWEIQEYTCTENNKYTYQPNSR